MIDVPESIAALLGSSGPLQDLRQRVLQVASTPEPLLVTGESGSGKNLVAAALHAASGRCQLPLVRLNCAVLSARWIESELFGHEPDAFAGAVSQRIGRFEMADGGTILLDNVGELPCPMQSTLLRLLEDRSFERLGGSNTIRVDVRVIATSHRDLRAEVDAGRFRQDLYYRLAVLPIHIPALREHSQDVAELANHFMHSAAERLHLERSSLSPGALQAFEDYRWPGNVRELENIAVRCTVLSPGRTVSVDDVQPWLEQPALIPADEPPVGTSLQEMERRLIESTLAHFAGHRGKTAEALGIGIRTLSGKLKDYAGTKRNTVLPRAHARF
jgi:DNA-binding NtrC family response regulator